MNDICLGYNEYDDLFLGYQLPSPYKTEIVICGFSNFSYQPHTYSIFKKHKRQAIPLLDVLELLAREPITSLVEYRKYDFLITTRYFGQSNLSIGTIYGDDGKGLFTTNWVANEKTIGAIYLSECYATQHCFNLSHALRCLAKKTENTPVRQNPFVGEYELKIESEIIPAKTRKLKVKWTVDDQPEKPSDLDWQEGPLPDVASVPYNSYALVWLVYHFPDGEDSEEWKRENYHGKMKWADFHGQFYGIRTAFPHKDRLNPLRWHDGVLPIQPHHRVKFFCWLRQE